VADELAKVPGVTTAVMVALGENGVKTIEDFADLATDDLAGWTERKKEKDSEAVRHKGFFAGFEISRQEAEEMIMQARVLAGWITADDLVKIKADAQAAAEAKAAAEAAAAAEAKVKA
jgi:transcription termination/antitermination protein NusA